MWPATTTNLLLVDVVCSKFGLHVCWLGDFVRELAGNGKFRHVSPGVYVKGRVFQAPQVVSKITQDLIALQSRNVSQREES